MANTLTIINKRRAAGDNKIGFVFQCVLSGSYVQGGAIGVPGETLNFNSALNPNKIARPKLPSVILGSLGNLPVNSDFTIEGMPAGYTGRVERNATAPTASNFVLRIFSSGGTEISSGAYSSVGALLVDATGVIIVCQVPLKNN